MEKFGYRDRYSQRGEDGKTQGEHRERTPDWSDASISPGMPEATRSWERAWNSSPEHSEGAWSCQHLDFGLLASRTVRE